MSLVKNAGPYGLITDQATPKTTPVDADSIGLSDSADSGFLKKLTWANLKATLIATAMTWTGKQTFSGFTVLGSGNVAIKIKKYTGTTPSTEGGSVTFSHGLTSSKILALFGKVAYNTGYGVIPNYEVDAEVQFGLLHDTDIIALKLSGTNSANILSKPFVVTVIYEE